MRRFIILIPALLSLITCNAMAASIDGMLGLTGRAGVIVPLKDSDINGTSFETEAGFTGGGGLIYGISKNLAVELDVMHATSLDVKIAGSKVGDAQSTDIALGIQYRFLEDRRLVPYVGIGADFIKGNIQDSSLDWTYGGHMNGGIDFFITKCIVLTAEVRYVAGVKSDIIKNDIIVGKYDPMNIVGTLGVRLFLPKDWESSWKW